MKTISTAFAVLTLLAGPAAAAAPAQTADIEVTVVVSGGGKITGGQVFAHDRKAEVKASGEKLVLAGLPQQRVAVTADLRIAGQRHLGVAVASPVAGRTVAVTVQTQPVADIDVFCASCHPGKGEPLAEGQIRRDIHVSNVEVGPKYLQQTKKYNERQAARRKAKSDVLYEPIMLEERVVKVAGKDVKRTFYTCESCHTLHLKTPWTKYARAPFRERGTLCSGCHF